MRKIYILLTVIGAALPYSFFIPFLVKNGLNLKLLFDLLFVNNISTFFAVDFLISSIVFWVFMYVESKRLHIKEWWICLLANLVVGLSMALPLFLFFRDKKARSELE
ncbi:DUF2834 domain-containing protein [Neobacillus sp. D3-1R]|uniref:DUF2834 domain-containing protein n=1 Tax=Neobacillus sp. D3-1R TaxID=3445778 RepID=UPI003F9F6A50